MTILKLPERPSVANPARKKQLLEEAVYELDKDIALLYSVAADVASTEGCPASETVESLQFLQARLRRNATKLLTLL